MVNSVENCKIQKGACKDPFQPNLTNQQTNLIVGNPMQLTAPQNCEGENERRMKMVMNN